MRRTRSRPHTVAGRPGRAAARPVTGRWTFRIYVTDDRPRSHDALETLTDLCEARVPGRYTIEVVDLLEAPERARTDNVYAVPTVVRMAPEPLCTVIGDLSDVARAAEGLLRPW